jgi:hypothetical protein
MTRRQMTEKETIESILKLAREQGVEEKVKRLIVKFQDAVKGAKNEEQRKYIAALGIAEIHKTIGCVGNLVVDHVEILPEDPSYQEAINASKSLVNLE